MAADGWSRQRAARYLRSHDKIGYMISLALPEEEADAWLELYAAFRDYDKRSEDHVQAQGEPVDAPASSGWRILALRPELAPILAEGRRWAAVEKELYSDPAPRPVTDYFRLMYYRGFFPAYVGAVLAMPQEDRRWLEAFSVYMGVGGQLIDDTLDLAADVAQGLMFITREEFEMLGLRVRDLATSVGLRKVTEWRNHWALAYHVMAYRATSAFSPANRRLARTFVEFSMRALLDGRVRPLPARVLADQELFAEEFGVVTHLFDIPAPSETIRREAGRPFITRVVNRYSLVSINEAVARLRSYPQPIPDRLMITTIEGMPTVHLDELDGDVPDSRRPIGLLHYGGSGLLPTMVDVLRVVAGL